MKQKNLILLVVAVGCGLVAAFLTSQMSARQVEQVEVLVAAKDLPVGTTFTREDVNKLVKVKKMPKDGLPPAFVVDREQLIEKRLSRPVRAEETFNPADLLKGGVVTLPPGHSMVSLPIGVGQSAAGFIVPGSRVDILATVRLNKPSRLNSFKLLVNMLVVAVNHTTVVDANNNGAFPNLSMVSFAVKEKEALVLSLAKARGCNLELMLRHPETADPSEANEKLEDVIKLMSDDNQGKIVGGESNERPKDEEEPKTEPKTPEVPQAAPAPQIAVVKVLVAKRDIDVNTQVTKDLLAEAFEWKELPKEFAWNALADNNFEEALGKAFKTGVSQGQYVTWGMVGVAGPKVSPRDEFMPAKPGERPVPRFVKPNILDVAIHTASGTVIIRYQEVEPGKWKKIAELTPEQAAKNFEPKAAPETRKID